MGSPDLGHPQLHRAAPCSAQQAKQISSVPKISESRAGKQAALAAKYAARISYNLILISGEKSSRVNKVRSSFCGGASTECLKNAPKKTSAR